ncbi:hypothetical protein LINPERHAP1_LOCUS15636 [Linum perenne]
MPTTPSICLYTIAPPNRRFHPAAEATPTPPFPHHRLSLHDDHTIVPPLSIFPPTIVPARRPQHEEEVSWSYSYWKKKTRMLTALEHPRMKVITTRQEKTSKYASVKK